MSFSAIHPHTLAALPPRLLIRWEAVLPDLVRARAELGELKGYAHALPNPMLFLGPAILRESVASSGIENINTTVEQVLQQQLFPVTEQHPADKEVLRYRDALLWGFERMKKLPLGNRLILGIHGVLLGDIGGNYRRTQNQIQNSSTGKILYTPPPAADIGALIGNWENYIHKEGDKTDPLIKAAIAHYQFEAIHPFGDGNGRTGRILMVLHLVHAGILNYPTLFISGFINRHRAEYYKLLNQVTAQGEWQPFIGYLMRGFYEQAAETKEQLMRGLSLLIRTKEDIRKKTPKAYSSDLVEALFSMPIITPVRLGQHLGIHYTTATRYLRQLQAHGFLRHRPAGKYQLYINERLLNLIRG